MPDKKCKFCGETFHVESIYSNKKFCSYQCRFKSFVPAYFGDACFEWPLSKNPQTGYGQMNISDKQPSKMVSTHRISFTVFNGPLAKGDVVRHSCDNRLCVNPKHLDKGSQADNIKDMWSRGRQQTYLITAKGSKNGAALHPEKVCKGEQHGASKLTDADIFEIRESIDSHASLGRRFGVTPANVARIRARKSWRHI